MTNRNEDYEKALELWSKDEACCDHDHSLALPLQTAHYQNQSEALKELETLLNNGFSVLFTGSDGHYKIEILDTP